MQGLDLGSELGFGIRIWIWGAEFPFRCRIWIWGQDLDLGSGFGFGVQEADTDCHSTM